MNILKTLKNLFTKKSKPVEVKPQESTELLNVELVEEVSEKSVELTEAVVSEEVKVMETESVVSEEAKVEVVTIQKEKKNTKKADKKAEPSKSEKEPNKSETVKKSKPKKSK